MPKKHNKFKSVSILGTGSDVGKSIVATALCRILKDLGYSVAPFKAQNMSNNSSVTEDGGEMGRAQVVQAQAAGIKPEVDMNPVLLKPSSNIGSQVVLQGKPVFNTTAKDYFKNTDFLFSKAKESFFRLKERYDVIVIEGAGSCGEVNLRNRDFVNFETAHFSDSPVILVADIDKGGVFAQIIGTLAVIPEKDRERVKGFIINRFRGDASLFDDGISYIEKKTGLPVLGLIPLYDHIKIDSEDSVFLEELVDPEGRPERGKVNIAVLRLPHISNFTDFSPFENDPYVNLHYLSAPRDLSGYDLVILPGTKNVRSDLNWLLSNRWQVKIEAYLNSGGELAGICGGYQMLGIKIHDPDRVEGDSGSDKALGLLPLETTMKTEKTLSRSSGVWHTDDLTIEGYEIHMGISTVSPVLKPLINLKSRNGKQTAESDGAISHDGKIWGTYFHGLFNNVNFRSWKLKQFLPTYHSDQNETPINKHRDKQYELLADHFRSYLDMDKLKKIIGY